MSVDACVPPEGAVEAAGFMGTPKHKTLETSSPATLLTPDMFGGAELAGDDEEDDEIVAVAPPKKEAVAPAMAEEVVEESEGESEDDKDEEFESANMSESGTGGVVAQRGVEMMDMKQIRAIVRDELRELLDEVKAERRQAAEERKADMERVRKADETRRPT